MKNLKNVYSIALFMTLISCINVQATVENAGRTPAMDLILQLDAKIKEIKYGQPGVEAFANSCVVDSYFLHGIYACVGPLVSDKIEAYVQNISQKIQKELNIASNELTGLITNSEDFMIQDNDGRTVLQYCTTKESYELLRQHGLKFKLNAAIRMYGRHYAPVFVDYVIFTAIAAYCTSGFTATHFDWDLIFKQVNPF
ncbi:MAG: hypothetical protein ACXWL2_03140 [Candidatus Chromulinivorax sp.]